MKVLKTEWPSKRIGSFYGRYDVVRVKVEFGRQCMSSRRRTF